LLAVACTCGFLLSTYPNLFRAFFGGRGGGIEEIFNRPLYLNHVKKVGKITEDGLIKEVNSTSLDLGVDTCTQMNY
jgi:hypothetical protein